MIEITPDIENVVEQLANAYRNTLRQEGKVASGELVNFTTSIAQDDKWFSVVFNLPDYWKYVENGRRAGKQPPLEAILNWITVKPIVPKPIRNRVPSTKQLAFLIARKIGNEGIKPTHALDTTINSPQAQSLIDVLCNLLIEQLEKPIDNEEL